MHKTSKPENHLDDVMNKSSVHLRLNDSKICIGLSMDLASMDLVTEAIDGFVPFNTACFLEVLVEPFSGLVSDFRAAQDVYEDLGFRSSKDHNPEYCFSTGHRGNPSHGFFDLSKLSQSSSPLYKQETQRREIKRKEARSSQLRLSDNVDLCHQDILSRRALKSKGAKEITRVDSTHEDPSSVCLTGCSSVGALLDIVNFATSRLSGSILASYLFANSSLSMSCFTGVHSTGTYLGPKLSKFIDRQRTPKNFYTSRISENFNSSSHINRCGIASVTDETISILTDIAVNSTNSILHRIFALDSPSPSNSDRFSFDYLSMNHLGLNQFKAAKFKSAHTKVAKGDLVQAGVTQDMPLRFDWGWIRLGKPKTSPPYPAKPYPAQPNSASVVPDQLRSVHLFSAQLQSFEFYSGQLHQTQRQSGPVELGPVELGPVESDRNELNQNDIYLGESVRLDLDQLDWTEMATKIDTKTGKDLSMLHQLKLGHFCLPGPKWKWWAPNLRQIKPWWLVCTILDQFRFATLKLTQLQANQQELANSNLGRQHFIQTNISQLGQTNPKSAPLGRIRMVQHKSDLPLERFDLESVVFMQIGDFDLDRNRFDCMNNMVSSSAMIRDISLRAMISLDIDASNRPKDDQMTQLVGVRRK